MTTSEEQLVEAFTLKKSYSEPMAPHWGGFAPGNHLWRMCRGEDGRTKWRQGLLEWVRRQDMSAVSHFHDIVYTNANGVTHRRAGPAYISTLYDFEIWVCEGEYHREDGPAIRHKNFKAWLRYGYPHRIGGPAIEDPAGPKEYWIDGHRYSPKEYKKECARRARKGIK